MSIQDTGPHLCIDGPLRGEYHHRGPRFGFDGAAVGEERGVYILEEEQYRWHVDPRAQSVVLVQSSHRTNLSVSTPSRQDSRRLA